VNRDTADPTASKDSQAQHPIAMSWRSTLSEVVARIAAQDYFIQGIASVDSVPAGTAAQIRDNVAGYGETVVKLPEESWATSVAQWMGDSWEVLVDLWTEESGRSDLVLSVRVFETEVGFRFQVSGVYVP